MKCAVDMLKKVAPQPTELWERGGATIETREIDGRSVNVPIFYDNTIDTLEPYGGATDIEYKGKLIGSRMTYRVEMSSGISRDVTVYLPPAQKLTESLVTIHMDTPWMTGGPANLENPSEPGGHNDKIAEAFMQHTDQPVIMVGPENMNQHRDALYVIRHLGSVATDASKVSLALAAQDSMQIVSELTERLGLSRQLVQVGESRAAMMAGAKSAHEDSLGLESIYYDLTDPCIAENVLKDPKNLIRLPLFLPMEAAQMVPVGIDLARRGSLHRERGTVPLAARYMAASVLGTGPALFSGEAGEFPAFLNHDDAVHIANFKYNWMSHHDKWREKYAHTQFAGVNLKGAHMGLAYSSVQRHVIERINRLIDELYITNGNVTNVDFRRVHLRDDQSTIGRHEHMPKVA